MATPVDAAFTGALVLQKSNGKVVLALGRSATHFFNFRRIGVGGSHPT